MSTVRDNDGAVNKAGTNARSQSGFRRFRDGVSERPTMNLAYRIGVGVIGTVVLIVGIIAIPYPGPGWLIVFAGLGILASEFAWAQRVLKFVKKNYDKFMEWFGRQNLVVKGLGVLFTTVVVVATLWLLGAIGMVAGWVGLDQSWLQSPI